MAFYENVFIARQDISSAAADALSERFTAIIQENGGKVTKKENWGLRNLAFKIKKNRKGHYVLLNIDAPSAAVHEMERQMRISEDVLRFLTIRVDELEEGPSVVLQYRSTREERPRRGERGGFLSGESGEGDEGRQPEEGRGRGHGRERGDNSGEGDGA
jgi:small subunit ribosomal protein S6